MTMMMTAMKNRNENTIETQAEVIEIPDEVLIRKSKNGDENSFGMLVKRYQNRLFRAGVSFLKNQDDAVDAVQEVFVKAYYNLSSFREDASFYTWIYRILYNESMNRLRKHSSRTFFSLDDDESTLNLESDNRHPDELLEDDELGAAIDSAIEQLPGQQKRIFIMKQIDGLTFPEISRILDISEGACKSSYFHAVRKLRGHLEQYGGDQNENNM